MQKFTRKRKAVELSVIFLLAALMILALAGLLGKVMQVDSQEPYPDLYAPGMINDSSPPADMTIYLTFDDGPSKNTEKILDILKEKEVSATFFVTAQVDNEEYNKKLYRRILDEGHVIGLHSYTHKFKSIYKSADAYLKDIDKLRALIEDAADYQPSILRFPGGSTSSNCTREIMSELKTELTRRGYAYYDWDVASGDDNGGARPVKILLQNMIGGVKKKNGAGTVILCHDNASPSTTPEAVSQLIDQLSGDGYSFACLTPDITMK